MRVPESDARTAGGAVAETASGDGDEGKAGVGEDFKVGSVLLPSVFLYFDGVFSLEVAIVVLVTLVMGFLKRLPLPLAFPFSVLSFVLTEAGYFGEDVTFPPVFALLLLELPLLPNCLLPSTGVEFGVDLRLFFFFDMVIGPV